MVGSVDEHVVILLPNEVMKIVFKFLEINDLKTVSLVCKTWNSLTHYYKFWMRAVLRISRDDIDKKLQCDKLGIIGNVKLDNLTGRQVERVLTKLDEFKWNNRTQRDPVVVDNNKYIMEAKNKIEIISLFQTIVQISTNIKLKHLNLCRHDLSTVQPELLAQTVIKVENVNLALTRLRQEQLRTVFFSIINTEQLSLKKLNLTGEGQEVSKIPPDLLALAAIKLEYPDKIMIWVTHHQVLAVCNKILELPKLKLKTKELYLGMFVDRDILPFGIAKEVKAKLTGK